MMKKTKMPMVKKGGKMVPAFAADGKGKMMAGGKATKGRAKMSSGGRTLSSTDASTAKSTPPKTGKDASFQRIVNSMTSFIKNNDLTTLTGAIKEAKEKAKGEMKEYRRPPRKKAMGGKTTKGRSKMMMGGKGTKGYAKGGRTGKK